MGDRDKRLFGFLAESAQLDELHIGLQEPHSLVFVDAFRILVSSANGIDEFANDGSYTGPFTTTNINRPRGLVSLPHLDPPQIAVASFGIMFFDLAGVEMPLKIEPPSPSTSWRPHDLAHFGDGQILIATESSGVFVASADGSSTPPWGTKLYDADTEVRITSLGSSFLVATGEELLECVDLTGGCTLFAECPEPTAVWVDEEVSRAS